jgi:hypothetical protein
MDSNVALVVIVAMLLVAGWAWPILAEVRELIIARIRARRTRGHAVIASKGASTRGGGLS